MTKNGRFFFKNVEHFIKALNIPRQTSLFDGTNLIFSAQQAGLSTGIV
jgi:hypothetical protein